MTYQVMIAGHAGDEEIERELVTELSKVLSHPAYGVSSSQFTGLYHNGPVHAEPAAAAEDEDG